LYTRVKVAGWAFGERLTSAQMNTLDIDHSTSVDGATLTHSSSPLVVSRRAPGLPSISDQAQWITLNQHLGYIECADANARAAFWPIRLPHGSTLTSLAVVIEPPGGHGALPISMPGFELISVTNAAALTTEVSFVTDSSASVGAYETVHTITSGALSVAILNTTKRYVLRFTSEGSTNAIAGLRFYHPFYNYTATALDPD
jgi:hypothetical protein